MTAADHGPAHEPHPDNASSGRRWFGGRGREDDQRAVSNMSDRLRRLGDDAVGEWQGVDEERTTAVPQRTLDAELTFLAGPRQGTRLSLGSSTIALDADGNEAGERGNPNVMISIWAQGQQFMLRPARGVRVGGTRPAPMVVVLEDGDDVEWGPHRLQVRIVASS